MNDPKLALDKIEELLSVSRGTDDLFARAAAFGAISILVQSMGAYFEKHAPYAVENMERLRFHSAAMLGYEITNGHSIEQHHVLALGALQALSEALRRLDK